VHIIAECTIHTISETVIEKYVVLQIWTTQSETQWWRSHVRN